MVGACEHGVESPSSIREWDIAKEAHWIQLLAPQEGIYAVL
jgi:hypothetical protein